MRKEINSGGGASPISMSAPEGPSVRVRLAAGWRIQSKAQSDSSAVSSKESGNGGEKCWGETRSAIGNKGLREVGDILGMSVEAEGPGVGDVGGVRTTMVSRGRPCLRLPRTEEALDETCDVGGGTENSRGGGGVRAGVREGDGTGVGTREGAGGRPYRSGRGPSGTPGEAHCAGNPSTRRET